MLEDFGSSLDGPVNAPTPVGAPCAEDRFARLEARLDAQTREIAELRAALADHLAREREHWQTLAEERQFFSDAHDRLHRAFLAIDPFQIGLRLQPQLFHLRQHPPIDWRPPAAYALERPPTPAPKISIVTPSYQQGAYLERTLQSVLDQNYPSLEYVVQDGGSTDASVEVVRRYADRLTSWESKRDAGQANAINLGLQRSTGEILAYLNSDDLLAPGSLAYVANFFARRPDVDVVYGHRYVIDADDSLVGQWILPRHDHELLAWVDYVPQETMFWRRRLWDAVGARVDEDYHFAMDWELILRFRSAGARFARLPRFLGAFRVTPAQKTSSQMHDVGKKECDRLRQRTLGRVPDRQEVDRRVRPYLRRHVLCRCLHRLGLVKY